MPSKKSIVEIQYAFGLVNESELFEEMFAGAALYAIFSQKHARSASKGTDRLNGFQFAPRALKELDAAGAKCRTGTFRFSPFLELLKPKGRLKPPRLVGIPTIRDRVILSQLASFLAAVYPERVPKNVASKYVREIAQDLKGRPLNSTWVCGTDIKTFYDSIDTARLLKVLGRRIKCQPALALLKASLATPTVPGNTPKKRYSEFRAETGIPQGLAISNILASIYMKDVDEEMQKLPTTYYRYVDDVLIYGDEAAVRSAYASLQGRLRRRNLELHGLGTGKTQIADLAEPFGYLGYRFQAGTVTIRESTTERFLQSIAAKFSDFVHNKSRRLEKFKYLDEKRLCDIFLMELNERISGAIQEKKRYGWIAYFNEITDLALLYRLDDAIRGMFRRLDEFGNAPPKQLKTLRRAYWEMKFRPLDGYVRNYDVIGTIAQKIAFLAERGRIDPAEALTDEQVEDVFNKYVHKILADMHADEGSVY